MRHLRNAIACLAAVSLAACAAEPMSADQASATLREFRDHSARVCDSAGRAEFRRAARIYAKAQRGAGELWPSVAALTGDSDAEAPDLEVFALGAMAFGLIPASDLGGDAPRIRRMLRANMPAGFSLDDLNLSGNPACGEAFSAFRQMTYYLFEAERTDRQMQRALRDGKSRRIQQLSERRGRIMRELEKYRGQMREALERARL